MHKNELVDPLVPETAAPRPAWGPGLGMVLPPAALSAICALGVGIGYLLFHALAELFSILIALTALVVATTSRQFTKNHFVVFIAVAIGWCSVLDLAHTLAFKGMGLLPADSANPATQLWIAARFLQAASLLAAPLFLRRSVRVNRLHLGFGLLVFAALLAIATGVFPAAYIDGQGLTPFKIYAEYLIIALLGTSLFRFWRQRALLSPGLFYCLAAAVLAMMLSEFAFTRYVSVYATANLVGHLFKIFAYWFVYVALVQNTLQEPFAMLARAASTYDAVPDPTLVVNAAGTVLQANQAAARYAGVAVEALVGRSSHTLFHDPEVAPEDCLVCARIAGNGGEFLLDLEKGPAGAVVECSVAPFSGTNGGRAYVQVIRDITERRQMQAERERLVYFLGERIKELRCHYAISALIERPDVDPPSLLAGVAELLPPAFQFPPQTTAFIQSDWGHFGSPCPPATPHHLERSIRVHGREVGRICVCYPADLPAQEVLFLPEEEALMEAVAQRVGETIEHSLAAAKIQRLSYLYEMLSATNRAIVHCRSIEELLETLFEALITHGTFPKVFIARSDNGEMPLHVAYSHGIDADYLPLLDEVLAERNGPFGRSFDDYKAGKIVCTLIPKDGQPDAWLGYLQQQGVRERAIMPLVRADKMVGVVGLYASVENAFDADQLRLLGEMASDMSFALNTLIVDERRLLAEQQAMLSEHRFRGVFEASPLPMQIRSLSSGALRALNQAHQQWLGYGVEELASEAAWFECFFPDPCLRQQIQQQWPRDIAAARASGRPVSSPELPLRCKDGRQRIARGSMSIVGDDVVIAWIDLTEMRRSEQELRESEQRFRGMIEQTLTGIYVRREREFVYVNPRFCDMLGWSAEALVGPDIQELLHIVPEMWQRSQSAWERLQAGEQSVTYSVPVQRHDGQQIELGIHATAITWDSKPAMIAMAQDVTERRRAEEQIANYVKRLEESMRATLHAVSNMVEMRDPYTAGHERRVGLIAGAIARELGWSEERCRTLEMVGLVHDIGKISVPAEILSKPTRLSALEMEMVRGHAEAGYDILKDVNFSAPVADIIHQHHERLDGSGYPRQLRGDEILIEARVLAVADVLESMAAHRPYRPALGLDAALAEIERGRGIQFDPEVVDAIVRLLREKGYALPQ